MKKTNSIFTLIYATGFSFFLINCGDGNSNSNEESKNDNAQSSVVQSTEEEMAQRGTNSVLIDHYMAIKTALVNDNSEEAAKAGQELALSTIAFDISGFTNEEQTEIKRILHAVKERAENIANSEITDQRETFEGMNSEYIDLIEITGTDRTLYKQFCPMYEKGKGGFWLSESSEIRNPLFGSKMLKCGSVTETISMN